MCRILVFLASVVTLAVVPVKAEPHQVSGIRHGDASSWTGTAAKLSKLMAGHYASDPDEKGYQVVDFRKPIAKFGEGEWIYYQRNQGTDVASQGKAYRQRVLQLIDLPDGSVAQRTWSLIEPKKFAGARTNPDILKLLTLDALTPTMELGCDQIWHQSKTAKMKSNSDDPSWEGSVNPKNCTIYSKRRDKRIAIGSQTRLTSEYLMEAERGFDLDGNQLWGTPKGQFTTMVRTD